jgi:hypothetical protein
MIERFPSVDQNADAAKLERRVNNLATERGELYDKAGSSFGHTAAAQQRLASIEQELDECYQARRTMRAERDARRFHGAARRPAK